MRYSLPVAVMLGLFLAGCSLAGDITPPPDLATAQAGQPLSPAVLAPTEPSATSSGSIPSPAAPVVTGLGAVDLQDGASIWAEKCAPCHGAAGMSDGAMTAQLASPPPKLGDPQVARSAVPSAWLEVVTQGRMDRFMPPFGQGLSAAQRGDVVAFALSLSSGAEEIARGQAAYEANQCAACHSGPGGTGPDLTAAGPAWQRSLGDMARAIQQGSPPAMPAYADKLNQEDTWALAAYVRSLAWSNPAPAAAGTTPAAAGTPVAGQAPAGEGTVRGRVSNGTPGGTVPPNLEVTLHGFDGDQEALTQNTKADASGAFEFRKVPLVSGRIYGVTADYGGILYYSQGAHITEPSTPLDLPVSIYENTTDPAKISVERLHVLFDFSTPDQVQVIELWIVSNAGDHTLVAAPSGGAMHVTLPEGAIDLSFEDGSVGGRYLLTPDGFADTQSVVPGSATSQFVFSFHMPYSRALDFRQPTDYPVDAVVVLMPDGGPTLQGGNLQDMGVRQTSGQTLRNYSGGAIPAGQAFEVRITGKAAPAAATNGTFSATNLLVGGGVLAIALALVGLWWFRRPRLAQAALADRPPADLAEPRPEAGTEPLLRSMAMLDDDFEAGRIEQGEYRRQREALKQELLDRMRHRRD